VLAPDDSKPRVSRAVCGRGGSLLEAVVRLALVLPVVLVLSGLTLAAAAVFR
jgi:hypothetical protein